MMKFKVINTTRKLWRVELLVPDNGQYRYGIYTDLSATSDVISVPYQPAIGNLVAILTDDQTAWWDVSAGGENVTLQDNVTYVFDGRNDSRYPMQIVPDPTPAKPSLLKAAAPLCFTGLLAFGSLIWGARSRRK
jgi:hypothetical protein